MAFKYPKITGFAVAIVLSYILFTNSAINSFILRLDDLRYLGAFIAGIFYAFGFTSPFSAGFFMTSNVSNTLFAGILGGLGALFADMLIFVFVKISFLDEFEKIKKIKLIQNSGKFLNYLFGKKIYSFLMYLFAAILIASPLPDEAGITVLAGLTEIKAKAMAIISFILNTAGILILLNL